MNERNSKTTKDRICMTGELCCALCGGHSNIIRFKNGYICVSCLQYVKTI
jgi:reverse gyrase